MLKKNSSKVQEPPLQDAIFDVELSRYILAFLHINPKMTMRGV